MNKNNNFYFNSDVMTDNQYETLVKHMIQATEIQSRDLLFSYFLNHRKNTNVNYRPHISPIQKITKSYTLDDIKNKIMKIYNNKDIVIIIETKLDGIMVNVIYHNGKLQSVVTRGDCYGGEDIIDVIKHIIPQDIIQYDPIEIRGEICISKENYNKYFSEYSSPRHAMISIISQKNLNIISLKKLEFYAHDFGILSKNIFNFSQSQIYIYLKALGINVVSYKRSFIYKLEEDFEKFKQKNYSFPTDGYIFKVENLKLQLEKFDYYSKDSSYCFAYKEIQKFNTQIESIDFNFNKSGICIPIANINPHIQYNNINCSKINLYSYNFVQKNNITDNAYIDILFNAIFVFHSVTKSYGKNIEFPKNCNVCQCKLQITGMHLACLNASCKNKLINTIAIICKQIGIKTIAKKTIEKLVDAEVIRDISDLFYINRYKEKIITIEGFQHLKINNFINAIDKCREKLSLEQTIICFGIPSIGINTANAIAQKIDKNNINIDNIKNSNCLNQKQKNEIDLFFSNSKNREVAQKIINIYKSY